MELLVALAVLSLVAAIIVPKFLNVQSRAQDTVAQQMAGELTHTFAAWQAGGGTISSNATTSDLLYVLGNQGSGALNNVVGIGIDGNPDCISDNNSPSQNIRVVLPAVIQQQVSLASPTAAVSYNGNLIYFNPSTGMFVADSASDTPPADAAAISGAQQAIAGTQQADTVAAIVAQATADVSSTNAAIAAATDGGEFTFPNGYFTIGGISQFSLSDLENVATGGPTANGCQHPLGSYNNDLSNYNSAVTAWKTAMAAGNYTMANTIQQQGINLYGNSINSADIGTNLQPYITAAKQTIAALPAGYAASIQANITAISGLPTSASTTSALASLTSLQTNLSNLNTLANIKPVSLSISYP